MFRGATNGLSSIRCGGVLCPLCSKVYSGFAYKYHDKDPLWDKLLKGKTGELITTCDAPRWWIWWQYRNSDLNAVKRATLEFCGIKPVKVTRISRVKYLDKMQRQAWLDRIRKGVK